MAETPVRFKRVVFLGTGSAVPCADVRNVSGMAVTLSNGRAALFDCGEGTQHQIQRAGKAVLASRFDLICITHLHGDHCFGLFGLLNTMDMQGREECVVAVGPRGLRTLLDTVLQLSQSQLSFPLEIIELDAVDAFEVVHPNGKDLFSGMRVHAFPLQHGDMPCYGYKVTEQTSRGQFLVEKAKALGVTDPRAFGKLTRGEMVFLEDDTRISPMQVLGPERSGRTLAFLQDLSSAESARQHLHGCDVLVHEATYADEMTELARERGHATAGQAGRFAADVKAHNLVLTHFSSRYSKDEDIQALQDEAASECPGVVVVAAKDFLGLGLEGQVMRVVPDVRL